MTMPTVGMTGNFKVPKPANEPPRSYAPGSSEANAVLHRIQELSHHVRELPHVIGGQRRMTEETWDVAAPHDHQNVIARMATAEDRKSTRLNSSHVSSSYAVYC